MASSPSIEPQSIVADKETPPEGEQVAMPMLSADDVRTLNEARAILATLEHDLRFEYPQTFRNGLLMQATDTARDAIFGVLNISNVYFGVEVQS